MHQGRRLHRFGGHGPIIHRHRLAGTGIDEGLTSCRLEGGAGLIIGLEVEAIEGDECNEEAVDINAISAEHAARPHMAQGFEQFASVRSQFVLCHAASCTIG